jgi:hypothetical protein
MTGARKLVVTTRAPEAEAGRRSLSHQLRQAPPSLSTFSVSQPFGVGQNLNDKEADARAGYLILMPAVEMTLPQRSISLLT